MVLSLISSHSQSSPHPWGVASAPASSAAKSLSSYCGFVCLPGRSSPAASVTPPLSSSSSKLHNAKKNYSAKWIDLLSPDSYSSKSIPLPGKIEPPRSGAVSFSGPDNEELFTFAGYAEVASDAVGEMPERYVVNDLWKFQPHRESTVEEDSSWGWTKVEQSDEEYIPGPRLATAVAVLPNNDNSQAVLLGGWDPQTPGTGGVILDDVSMLDLDSLKWSTCTTANNDGDDVVTVPGGPTSRHVAVPLSINQPGDKGGTRNVICLHNHRCVDRVLLLSTTNTDGESKDKVCIEWEHQPVTGDVPSSRGLHCAAPLVNKDSTPNAMVIFGGAAQEGNMSNEAFVLDANTWKWTKLDCGDGDDNNVPSPRAGANLCSLDENTVLLFGGATPGEGGLLGLDDVWVLHVDMEGGKGKWQRLAGSDDQNNDGACLPPGRNAAALTEIDMKSLPKDIVWKGSSDDDGESAYYLLQGGWYPFRKTYNDVFLLRVSVD